MDLREWLPGVEPDEKCIRCAAATTADGLCLAHLNEETLISALQRLRDGSSTLDVRGVELDTQLWERVRSALTPEGAAGPHLSSALLAQATFGEGADLGEATFGEGADLGGATFGDGAILSGAAFGDGADLGGATFGDGANLTGVTFGDGANLTGATFGNEANLHGATFGNEANLHGARFGDGANLTGARFGDGAYLRGARFGDGAYLRGARFGDGAYLSGVTFGKGAYLRGARFGDGAYLSGVRFGDGPDLRGARFDDRANLIEVRFGDGANLTGATFGDRANLHGARFGNWANLSVVTFGDRANLSGATFGDRANLHGATFGNAADLGEATFGDGTILIGTTFREGADLGGATFGEEADLRGATFGEEAYLSGATFGDGANLSGTTFGDGANLGDSWFGGDVAWGSVTFRGQQRMVGPLYAAGTVDLHDAQFGTETRLEVDAAGLVLSRAVFGGPVEIRVLRAKVEASETRFEGPATIGPLDSARRPSTKLEDAERTDRAGNPLQHAQATQASVWSLRRTDVSRLMIAGVRVDEARFAGAQGLEKLRLLDTSFTTERGGRQRVAEEALLDEPDDEPTADERRMGHPKAPAEQVSEIYRSLRKSREDAADAPGGNDLYVGEQQMRRRALRELSSQTIASRGRRALLALYAWVGGYGVRPVYPFAALFALLGAGWALAVWFGMERGGAGDALVFAFRSVLLLPNSDNIETTTAGDALQVALRVLGPLLIGLIALGLRAQVKR